MRNHKIVQHPLSQTGKEGRSMERSIYEQCSRHVINYYNKLQTMTTAICLRYLQSLLNYHTPTRSLRSANTNLLSVPRVRTAFASCGFSVAAPAVWNSLPSGIHDSSSTHTFRRLLKTHCFQQAFGSPWPLVAHPSALDLATG